MRIFSAKVLPQGLQQALRVVFRPALLLAVVHLRDQPVAARLCLFALGLGGVAQAGKAGQGGIKLRYGLCGLSSEGGHLPQGRLQLAVQQQAGNGHGLL